MRVFIAVADAGSLSAAGRRVGMPLATVSGEHLAALEEQLAAALHQDDPPRCARPSQAGALSKPPAACSMAGRGQAQA